MFDISNDVLKRGAEGDNEAFEEIYRKTSSYIFSLVVRILGNQQEAEEVTQDVFLRIFKSLKNFRYESSFKTWIYRIAVNVAFSHAKKYTQNIKRFGDFDSALLSASIPHQGEIKVAREENEKMVQRMLNILNPDQRACVILKDIDGLKYEEIAEVLDININTVRSRLKRARDILMKTFGKRGSK